MHRCRKHTVLLSDDEADVAQAVVLLVAKSILVQERLRKNVVPFASMGTSNRLAERDRLAVVDVAWLPARQEAQKRFGDSRRLGVLGL
jgi:hypothetical protein